MELLVVLAVLAALLAILAPSFSAAREQARRAACAVQMQGIAVGLKQFATSNRNCLPPFAFSDHRGNLPLSGHWGGWSQPGDPDCFGRDRWHSMENVNLWRLVTDGMVTPEHLRCPGAACPDGEAGCFPYTTKSSTYCLRMPYSEGIFRRVPELLYWGNLGLLGIYIQAAGGVRFHFGNELLTVPHVRTDLTYREIDPATGERRIVDLARGAVLADTFWYQGRREPAGARAGVKVYEVRAGWCHGQSFNVLFGDGAVRAIRDDGTVAANTVAPGANPANDGCYFASRAITVWRYFEDNR